MAIIEINRNEQYVNLTRLIRGDFFLKNDDLYVIIDSSCVDEYKCMNLSDCNNVYTYDARGAKVLAVIDDKVKITVDLD